MDVSAIPEDDLRKKVAALYGFNNNIKIKIIKYSENITYLIEDDEKKAKYVLRLCRPEYHDKEELESEMLWINTIKETTDLYIADSYPGINGDRVQQVTLLLGNEYEIEFYCCLFLFLKGENLRNLRGEELNKSIEKIGQIIATLHNQVLKWEPALSKKLKRFTWNFEDFFSQSARWGVWRDFPNLTDEERNLYDKAEKLIKKRLIEYGKENDRYGLIHTDLNLNNVIVDGSKVQIFDFDDCGYGWFLYDMSTTLLEYEDNLEDMLESWLKGYESIRSLSQEDYKQIMTFIVLRKIVRVAWIGSHWENDTVKKVSPTYYEHTDNLIKAYLTDGCQDDYKKCFKILANIEKD